MTSVHQSRNLSWQASPSDYCQNLVQIVEICILADMGLNISFSMRPSPSLRIVLQLGNRRTHRAIRDGSWDEGIQSSNKG